MTQMAYISKSVKSIYTNGINLIFFSKQKSQTGTIQKIGKQSQ